MEIRERDNLGTRANLGKGMMADGYTIYVRGNHSRLCYGRSVEKQEFLVLSWKEMGTPWVPLSAPTFLSPREGVVGFGRLKGNSFCCPKAIHGKERTRTVSSRDD